MDDFPTRIADFLERFTQRIRSTTVDRFERAARWVAAAPLLAVLGIIALVLFLVGFHRILAELLGAQWSWTIIGGLFAALAAFLWFKRNPRSTPE